MLTVKQQTSLPDVHQMQQMGALIILIKHCPEGGQAMVYGSYLRSGRQTSSSGARMSTC